MSNQGSIRSWPLAGRAYNETPEGRRRISEAIGGLVWYTEPSDTRVSEAVVNAVTSALKLESPTRVTSIAEVAARELFGIEVEGATGSMRLYFVAGDQPVPVACDRMSLPADPDGQNDDRARWAAVALDAFATEVYQRGSDDEPPATCLTDLLCDLMHWADRNEGVDFDESLASARGHYEEETYTRGAGTAIEMDGGSA